MNQKYPELARVQKLMDLIIMLITGLIYSNNQKLAEYLQGANNAQIASKVEILPKATEDARVIIANTGTKLTSGGTLQVMGEAYNIAGYELSEVELIVALYDENDRVVDRDSDTICNFAEGRKYIFEITIFDAAPFVRYEVIAVVTE
jgi:hypothetical protein